MTTKPHADMTADGLANHCAEVMAPPRRTPQEREADERQAEEDAFNDAHDGLGGHAEIWDTISLDRDMAESKIAELEAIIEELHVANKHLAGRIDRAELRTITLERRIDNLEIFMKRAIEADPRLGEPTIDEQCKVSWTQPTEEDEL